MFPTVAWIAIGSPRANTLRSRHARCLIAAELKEHDAFQNEHIAMFGLAQSVQELFQGGRLGRHSN
jgi:hypothetical protein